MRPSTDDSVAGGLRCGDQVESGPFLGSFQSAGLWGRFSGVLPPVLRRSVWRPAGHGWGGVRPPAVGAGAEAPGEGADCTRTFLFYFLPLPPRLTSPAVSEVSFLPQKQGRNARFCFPRPWRALTAQFPGLSRTRGGAPTSARHPCGPRCQPPLLRVITCFPPFPLYLPKLS